MLTSFLLCPTIKGVNSALVFLSFSFWLTSSQGRVNSGAWWWTGRPGCCNPWGRKESDTPEWLNWADCSPPGSSVHGVLQARILEWVAMSSSRGSSWSRHRAWVFWVPCTGRQNLHYRTAGSHPQLYLIAEGRQALPYTLVFDVFGKTCSINRGPGTGFTHPCWLPGPLRSGPPVT